MNEEIKQKRRRYRLHYNLRRKGNTVIARERTVFKRANQLSDIESGWIGELLSLGYGISAEIFTPPPCGGLNRLINYSYGNKV